MNPLFPRGRRRVLLLALSMAFAHRAPAAESQEAVRGLIRRIAPGHVFDFVLEPLALPAGENGFEIETRGGKIVLRGDGPSSLTAAFNWYLKHDAFVDVSWYADDPVTVPARLPLPPGKIRRSSRVRERFFLNYCTFGYSMPFWRWRDWERFIDWMALNGINLPLAQNGNEAVWQKVWRSYGLSDAEIRAYFTGPAYLPWHRMANIDHWDGPPPQSFIDGQAALQKRIVARERELGMSPVLCGFAGHVPEALHAHQPAMKIGRIPPGWGGMAPEYGCWFLDPLDPKFAEIQERFLREQRKEYGVSHYLGADPFNEITPPSWDPEYLASVSRAIYRGMAAADPDAVWLQMAWTFSPPRDQNWTPARLSAMLTAVPRGRMVLLDYHCEDIEMFRRTQDFYGCPFIWSYLGNFGGNTYLGGPLGVISDRMTAVLNDPKLTNCAGVGATLEGLNNPAIYEFVFDRVWGGPDFDLSTWVRDEARAHAAGPDPAVESGWRTLQYKVFLSAGPRIRPRGVVFQEANPSLLGRLTGKLSTDVPYDNRDLLRAWKQMLGAGKAARATVEFQRDLIDITRQSVGNLGLELRERMADAYRRKDAAAFRRASQDFLEQGRELDDFLGTRTEFMLGNWLGKADSWAAGPQESGYFERDARRLITVWGGHLIDYSGRQWNGLLRDYYLPRWRELIDATNSELDGGAPVDFPALQRRWREHDQAFVQGSEASYATLPRGDYFAMSRALNERWASSVAAVPHETHHD